MKKHLTLMTAAGLALLLPMGAGAQMPFPGFLEVGYASRVVEDEHSSDSVVMEEARLQLDMVADADAATMQFRGDFVHDGVDDDTYIDVRDANVVVRGDSADLKVGRQVLTWGTGDLLFLNDLFPKDWQSFFIGRDDEYLKKPSDSARFSWFAGDATLDLVWTPVFTPDGYITGERLSFWSPQAGSIVGPSDPGFTPVDGDEPDRTFRNSEFAARAHTYLGSWEGALYWYRGFYGQPKAFDPSTGNVYFPRLESYGASLLGTLAGGVANFETSWYRSLDDEEGDDPFIVDSELRVLVGFTREVVAEHSLGVQFYMEWMPDAASGPGQPDDRRYWITARYTGFAMQQNLILSLFAFYSPDENDAYLRPKVTYKISDELKATVGGNVFLGEEQDTFFGQFEDATNAYARLRYSFY